MASCIAREIWVDFSTWRASPCRRLPIRTQQRCWLGRAARHCGLFESRAYRKPTCAGSRAVNWSRSGAFCATAVMNPNSDDTTPSSVSSTSTSPNRSQRMRRRRASRGGGGGGGAKSKRSGCSCRRRRLRMEPAVRGAGRRGMVPRRPYSAASILRRVAPDAIIDDLLWRGQVQQTTDEARIRARLLQAPARLYCGFDPTAPSLQVGNLVPLFGLARFQRAGHAPIALLGGGTGLIGNPRQTSERELRGTDTVREWAERIRPQLERFLDFAPSLPNAAVLVDNYEWLGPMTATEFLRDVGKHFPVGYMLGKETIRSRMEAGISYTEFSYMLLQAYDYLMLSRRFGCRLQIGGSDQWGNITAGCELIRRVDGGEADALTLPLVTKADGEKFGKSEAGAVYLDPAMTSPFAFYQFWLQQDDADAGRFLRVFSFRSHDEIMELDRALAERPHERAAQRALAAELTELVH